MSFGIFASFAVWKVSTVHIRESSQVRTYSLPIQQLLRYTLSSIGLGIRSWCVEIEPSVHAEKGYAVETSVRLCYTSGSAERIKNFSAPWQGQEKLFAGVCVDLSARYLVQSLFKRLQIRKLKIRHWSKRSQISKFSTNGKFLSVCHYVMSVRNFDLR